MKGISLLKNRNTYSSIVFILVLVSEAIVIAGLKYQIQEMIIWPLAVLAPIFMLVIIGWLYGKYEFWPQSTIFTKLMANAIAPSWWGAFYLLFFVIHIGWLTNGSFELFKSSNLETTEVVISLVVGLIGLFILICFFPDGKIDKRKAKKVVFVSGMSKLSIKETDIKDNTNSTNVKIISLYNQVPLVSFFQLVFNNTQFEQSDVSKMLILSTKAHYEDNVFTKSAIDISELIKNDVLSVEDGSDSFLDKNRIKVINDKYLYYVSPYYDVEGMHENTREIEDILKIIIKITLLEVFPEHKNDITKLTISLTEACDYDNFEECFETLNNAIKKEDNNNQLLYFNLTPGTGIVGSLMTLFSIDKDRELFFYAQNSSKLLLPVEKSKLPLENLLSQALEKIKDQKN